MVKMPPRRYHGFIVPLKWIEHGVYGDLFSSMPKAIFYLLKGGYRLQVRESHRTLPDWGTQEAASKLGYSLNPKYNPIYYIAVSFCFPFDSPLYLYHRQYIHIYVL